jgi:hypothetical protein
MGEPVIPVPTARICFGLKGEVQTARDGSSFGQNTSAHIRAVADHTNRPAVQFVRVLWPAQSKTSLIHFAGASPLPIIREGPAAKSKGFPRNKPAPLQRS